MRYLYIFTCLVFFVNPVLSQKKWQKAADQVSDKTLDGRMDDFTKVADQIWDLSEVGYQETQSSEILQELLTSEGFEVEAGVGGMPTAFVASFGSGEPVIGILAEFDALPGLGQAAVPAEQKIPNKGAGHACGHHLFGTASTASAIALKDWLKETGVSGTVKVFGTPAEEGGGGKIYVARAGLLKGVDAVINWHPSSANSANPGSSLANISGKFRFYGKSAHAAGAPEQGRSALDGLESMNYMLNLMREHVTQETRIHYIVTSGGDAPNIVPNFAEGYFYVRHPDIAEVKRLWARVVNIAEAAAKGTETTMEYEITNGVYNLLPNEKLARIMHKNLVKVGGYDLDVQELEFAQEIQKTLINQPPLTSTNAVAPFSTAVRKGAGSTDVGDISWLVPTTGLRVATWVPGTPGHSWQAVAAGGMSIGHKGMMVAAKTMYFTAVDLFMKPDQLKEIWEEFESRRGTGFTYEALVGDREPPLDYRK